MTAGPTSFFARAHEGDFANIEEVKMKGRKPYFLAKEGIVLILAAEKGC